MLFTTPITKTIIRLTLSPGWLAARLFGCLLGCCYRRQHERRRVDFLLVLTAAIRVMPLICDKYVNINKRNADRGIRICDKLDKESHFNLCFL